MPLVESVREALPAIQRLVRRAQDDGIPIIYVDDNYGDWSAGPGRACRAGDRGPGP
ncbi:MAG TPA: hypothetical protein VNA28_00050 [Solirubrobacteraceae bacterium]|nr:hypothetical protein [Solirubrobacteraceae bacterium]